MTDDRILGSDAARAVGRFQPGGPTGYRAKSGGPLRATRAEAEADERAEVERRASLCGWCTAAPGARIPHRRAVPSTCPCACHDERDEE